MTFLQEKHSDASNKAEWRSQWDGEVIMSHLPQSFSVEEVIKGRLVVVRACFEHYNVVFIHVHAPLPLLNEICIILNNCSLEEMLFFWKNYQSRKSEFASIKQ